MKSDRSYTNAVAGLKAGRRVQCARQVPRRSLPLITVLKAIAVVLVLAYFVGRALSWTN